MRSALRSSFSFWRNSTAQRVFSFSANIVTALPGLRHALAVGFGFLGGVVDFRAARSHRGDELRRRRCVLRDFAGGFVLLGHRAVDMREHRLDRIDGGGDAMDRVERRRGVLLQGVDLLLDLFGGALGLDRQRLHFGRDDRKPPAGGAGSGGLDGRIQREQRGLLGDGRDQVDHIAMAAEDSRSRSTLRLASRCGFAGLVGELAGVADLRADAVGRLGELFRGLGEGLGGGLRVAGAVGQGVGAMADGGQGGGGGLRAAGHRIGRALELADHCDQFELKQFEDFAGRVVIGRGSGFGRRDRRVRGKSGFACSGAASEKVRTP